MKYKKIFVSDYLFIYFDQKIPSNFVDKLRKIIGIAQLLVTRVRLILITTLQKVIVVT